MSTLLDTIIDITESKSGYIASVNTVDDSRYLSFETISRKMITSEELLVPKSMMIDVDKTESICTWVVKENKAIITNNVTEHQLYYNSYKPNLNMETYACVPYSFGGNVIGILALINRERYTDEMLHYFNIFGSQISILQNNYTRIRRNSMSADSRFMTFRLMEEVLNTTYNGIMLTNDDFDIIYMNNSMKDMVSKSKTSSYVMNNLLDTFPELEILRSKTENKSKLFKNRKIGLRVDIPDNLIVFEFIVNSVISYNRVYNVIMVYDVTSQVLSDEKIQKSQTNFVAYLSHELRNPLQSITLSNYLLQNTDSGENTDLQMSVISRSCDEMKRIINDILDLSKIEAREFIIEFDLCNIQEITENVINEYLEIAQEKGLNLVYNLEKNLPNDILTDDVRINQILSNLVSNAIKYSKIGTVTLNVKYNMEKNGVIFDVIDQGSGIKKEEIKNLFKQFGFTSNSYKLNSNGLGLCISQKLANLLDGHITVRSDPEKGSTFSLYIPVKLGISGTYSETKFNNKNLHGRVLLVDDNEYNLLLLKMLFDNYNCQYKYNLETNYVTCGKDAIELCKLNDYDIIFMDINMLDIDGCTASRMIRTNGYNGKIIATTGNILASKENCKLNTDNKFNVFDDTIIKPYDSNTILKMLNKYLSN
jgi:signal transduction histidine kinase